MMGSIFAGTEESPGETIIYEGTKDGRAKILAMQAPRNVLSAREIPVLAKMEVDLAQERVAFAVHTIPELVGVRIRQSGGLPAEHRAIRDDGQVAGSVSGGCVEVDVIQAAAGVMSSGESRLLEYGVSDELAFSVGLACGGRIRVYVEALE